MFCCLKKIIRKMCLKRKGIIAFGIVDYNVDPQAKVLIQGQFNFGATTLGNFSDKSIETIFIAERDTQITIENATLGRGARVKCTQGAQFKMGSGSYIADGGFVSVASSLSIGKNCAISWEVQIIDNDGHRLDGNTPTQPIVIGDHVWIGSRAMILKGTELGDGCVVAAGAVVSGKFPSRSLIGGVPAKVIRENISWE